MGPRGDPHEPSLGCLDITREREGENLAGTQGAYSFCMTPSSGTETLCTSRAKGGIAGITRAKPCGTSRVGSLFSFCSLLVSPLVLPPALPAQTGNGSTCGAVAYESSSTTPGLIETYRPLTGEERWRIYLREAFWSPGAFVRAVMPAAGSHLNNEPPEWGQGGAGFGRRVANRFGRFALQESYEAAAAAALGHDVRYFPSRKTGFLRRSAHALKSEFVTLNKHGRQTPHIARIGATFAAEFTANSWMPPSRRGASEALRGVGLRLGIGSAFNLLREFAPELKRLVLWSRKEN